MTKTFIKFAIVLCLVISIFQWAPKKAQAYLGVFDTDIIVSDTSVSGISNWGNTIAAHLKDYVLDHLATVIAKQILHQLTLSVIDWINSGYQGNPAFITNPGDFFSNVADQVAGDFISNSGPLAQLCSPFSIDVRVNIGLQQSRNQGNSYACTLSDVITNAKNVSVNGRSIQGFLGGDFSQGGWGAFISMTTEPQNNAAGAYLKAQSDLQANISSRHAAIKLDLQLGQGFMSYQTCTDATSAVEAGGLSQGSEGGTLAPGSLSGQGDQSIVTGHDTFGNNATVQKKVDPKTGVVSYQQCQTQTPGSVVASKLFANTNSSELELALADSINSVISAAITQLTSSLLHKGLYALSGHSSSDPTHYTENALAAINLEASTNIASTQTAAANAAVAAGTQGLTASKSSYDQAIVAVGDSKTNLATAATCFDAKVGIAAPTVRGGADYAATQASIIRSWSTIHLDPVLSTLVVKQQLVANQIATAQSGVTTQATPHNLDDIQQQLPSYQTTIQNSIAAGNHLAAADTSVQDLANAQTLAGQANSLTTQFKAACDAYPAQQIYVALP